MDRTHQTPVVNKATHTAPKPSASEPNVPLAEHRHIVHSCITKPAVFRNQYLVLTHARHSQQTSDGRATHCQWRTAQYRAVVQRA